MNLLEQLGLDPETFTWHDLAACVGIENADIFYDRYETDKRTAKQVDEMCLHCPVMKQCAQAGMNGETGVWGAVYWNGNGKPDASKNEHKTEDVWWRIREAMQE